MRSRDNDEREPRKPIATLSIDTPQFHCHTLTPDGQDTNIGGGEVFEYQIYPIWLEWGEPNHLEPWHIVTWVGPRSQPTPQQATE